MAEPGENAEDYRALRRILDERFSCRAFRPEPAPRETIENILAAAQRTASWCNSQPWQVLLLSGEPLAAFARALHAHASAGGTVAPDFAFPSAYEGQYRERRRECGFALYDSIGVGREDRAAAQKQMLENFRFFGAPHAAIVTCEEKLGIYAAVDCGGYVANFLNAAQALGIAAIPQAAIASHPDFIRSHFGLPRNQFVVCAISFGFPDTSHAVNGFRTTRADLSQAVRWIGG